MEPDSPPAHSRRELIRPCAILFFGICLVYGMFLPGRPLTVDGKTMLDTVRALAHGSLAVPESLVTRPGRHGNHYCLYAPLLPALSLPGFWLGGFIDGSWPRPGMESYSWADRFALAMNAWVSAALVTLVFAFCYSNGAPFASSVSTVLLLAFTTMLFPYARDYFSQPLAGLGMVGAFVGLIQLRHDPRFQWIALSSASMGCAVLARMDMLALVPGWLLAGALTPKSPLPRGEGTWYYFRGLAAFGGPVFVCVGLMLGFDAYRWGGLLATPYAGLSYSMPLIDTIPRFLWSKDLSLFLYNPILLISIPCLVFTWNRFWPVWSGMLVSCAIYICLVASFADYHGGICVGPRYLVPIALLLFLPLPATLADRKRLPVWAWSLAAPLSLLGLLVNGYSAWVDYTEAAPAWEFWMQLLGWTHD